MYSLISILQISYRIGRTTKFGKPEQVFLQKGNVDVELENYTCIPVKSYVILLSYTIFTAQKSTNGDYLHYYHH